MTKPLRCAIYTRKSSEEGLEQSFNSLHAQREACEAYIKSQQHEGWRLIRTHYDDGGFSGGNLQRPALQKLLTDIDDGRVDAVLVYKVDRLTRSLGDFARIVDRMDARQVSFVSVTQSFNTTTSMGRLTLNMLLSFAQFEREVTGERIRDKIAVSKAKGIFMGGTPPLGYRPEQRRLVIVPEEAQLLLRLFERYAALGSITKLEKELADEGIVSRAYVRGKGRCGRSSAFQSGPLLHILRNPTSIGEISHKGVRYPGQHEPIIDRELWEAVQAKLDGNREKRRLAAIKDQRAALRGLVRDADGAPLSVVEKVGPSGRRYAYYVGPADRSVPTRFSASRLDALVEAAVLEPMTPAAREEYASSSVGHRRRRLRAIVSAVTVSLSDVVVTVDARRVGAAPKRSGPGRPRNGESSPPRTVDLKVALPTWRTGARIQRPEGSHAHPAPMIDRALVEAVARAHRWRCHLESGLASSVSELAAADGVNIEQLERELGLAYLSPEITRDLVFGGVTGTYDALTVTPLSLDWQDQTSQLRVNVQLEQASGR